jgi:hypothetical protein
MEAVVGLIDILKNPPTKGAKAPKPVPEMPATLEEEEQRRLRARMRVYPGLSVAARLGTSCSNKRTKRKAAGV